jgi:hypothetical protein
VADEMVLTAPEDRRAETLLRAEWQPGGFSPFESSDAQREQGDRADTDDQDHQGHRVVIKPM